MTYGNQKGHDGRELPQLVLVVEDDVPVQLAMRLYLEHLGLAVLIDSHGSSGLSRLKSRDHGIEAVIVDWAMPRMNGAEFARLALELEPKLGIVIMSGFDRQQLPGLQKEVDPTSFLKKPFSLADLRSALVAAFKLSRTASAAQGTEQL